MNPVYNTICAVLEEAGLLTHEAAQKLAKHMQSNIHQSDFEDALKMVQQVSRKIDDFADKSLHEAHDVLESTVESLTKRVDKLESSLKTSKSK